MFFLSNFLLSRPSSGRIPKDFFEIIEKVRIEDNKLECFKIASKKLREDYFGSRFRMYQGINSLCEFRVDDFRSNKEKYFFIFLLKFILIKSCRFSEDDFCVVYSKVFKKIKFMSVRISPMQFVNIKFLN